MLVTLLFPRRTFKDLQRRVRERMSHTHMFHVQGDLRLTGSLLRRRGRKVGRGALLMILAWALLLGAMGSSAQSWSGAVRSGGERTALPTGLRVSAGHGYLLYLYWQGAHHLAFSLMNQTGRVSYFVHGNWTGESVYVQAPGLGRVEMTFDKAGVERSPKGRCWESILPLAFAGRFKGSLSFSDPSGLVNVQAAYATPIYGEPFEGPIGGEGSGKVSVDALHRGAHRETFIEAGLEGRRSIFAAFLTGRESGWPVKKLVMAHGGSSRFESVSRGEIALRPPPPFSGHATVRSLGSHNPEWRGAIGVRFPGGPVSYFRSDVEPVSVTDEAQSFCLEGPCLCLSAYQPFGPRSSGLAGCIPTALLQKPPVPSHESKSLSLLLRRCAGLFNLPGKCCRSSLR
jgi:hypothetical protein